MKTIDFVLVGDVYRSLGLDDQFSERPYFIEGIGRYMTRLGSSESKPKEKARAELRLRPNEMIYASAADIFGLNPEVLSVWLRIVNAVENSRLVVAPFVDPFFMGKFRRRLWNSLDRACEAVGIPRSRVTILDSHGGQGMQNLIDASDIYLDCFPCSGLRTTAEALLAGKPVVTLDGKLLRSNLSAGMLRSLQLDDLIAVDIEDYVTKAIRFGSDNLFRAEVGDRILAAATDVGNTDLQLVTNSLEKALLELVTNQN
jgi:predicted O-linked N-acetylglucosamine transferase (SPINDLY family)